jgi:retron-type reverse transcriptase
LSEGVWRPGPSRRFVIHDPKEREITAAPFRDRVVHHAVCAAVGPVLERAAIEHSYACRPGKGVHAAVRQCQRFCQSRRYFLKCDVRGFYSSVDHAVLMWLLCRVVKDRPMLDLLGLMVDTGVGVSGAGGAGGRGLPIGNLTSQYFANFIPTGLDLFVLQERRSACRFSACASSPARRGSDGERFGGSATSPSGASP